MQIVLDIFDSKSHTNAYAEGAVVVNIDGRDFFSDHTFGLLEGSRESCWTRHGKCRTCCVIGAMGSEGGGSSCQEKGDGGRELHGVTRCVVCQNNPGDQMRCVECMSRCRRENLSSFVIVIATSSTH